jgi:hypothetical protein
VTTPCHLNVRQSPPTSVALFAIFAVNAAMIFFGALQEKYEEPGSGGLLPFFFG